MTYPDLIAREQVEEDRASNREVICTQRSAKRVEQEEKAHNANAAIDTELLERCLKRICASSEFVRSDRTMTLLLFLVEQTVAGKGVGLKERLLGESIFGRSPDWDPKLDPIVRITAGRLRAKLDSYYKSLGSDDPIRIYVPKGSYIAHFEALATPPPPSTEVKQEIAIVPPQRGVGSSASHLRHVFTIALLILGLLGGLLFLGRSRPSDKEDHFSIVPFATELGKEFSPAISPNGQWIAYVWDGNSKNYDIYLKSLDGKLNRRITANSGDSLYPSWSPDGQSLAFIRISDSGRSLMTVPVQGGAEREVTELSIPNGRWSEGMGPLIGNPGPAWTREGKELIVFDRSEHGLILVSLMDGKRRKLTESGDVAYDFYPRVSPDGTKLAFIRYSTHGVGELYVMALPSGETKALTADGRSMRGLSWTPDARSLVFASNRSGNFELWRVDSSGKNAALLSSNSSSVSDPSIAPDASSLFFTEQRENWNIWRIHIAGGKASAPQLFISSSGHNHSPRFSPDGKQIAFVSDRSGSWNIWLCNQDGSNLTQLTHFDGPWLGGLAWSSDGLHIAFDARVRSHSSIYIVSTDGVVAAPWKQNSFEEQLPSWADKTSLYFSSSRDGPMALYRRNLNSDIVTKIADRGFASALSFNGKLLYIGATDGTLMYSDPDGKNTTPLIAQLQPYEALSWALFKEGIYILRSNTKDGAPELLQGSHNHAESLGFLPTSLVPNQPNIAASPDGHTLLIVQQDRTDSDILKREGFVE